MVYPVIDFHIHTIYYERHGESALNWIKAVHAGKNWQDFYEINQDPDFFVQYLHENSVDYGVVLAELCPAVTGTCSNEYVLNFCQRHDALIPFASINPYLTTDMPRELQRLISQGFRGLKMYPTYQHFYPNDPSLYPLYACAQDLQIPVMFHTGSSIFKGARLKYGDPIYLDDVAVDFPELKIILVHGGRGFWYDRAFFLTRLHEHIYLEVSGLPPQKLMDYYPELDRIAEKVIFGSDWPGVVNLKENIEAIRQLPLSKDKKELILGGTAAKILNIL